MRFTGVKVFSATKAKEREELGESITRWLQANADLEIVDRVVSQSSDNEFHCLTIVLFYRQGRLSAAPDRGAMKLKQRPEDFSVTESWRFDHDPRGAVVRLPHGQAEALHLRGGGAAPRRGPGPARRRELLRAQGQAGADHPARRRPRRPRWSSRSPTSGSSPSGAPPRPLSAANTTSNRFAVTVRDLSEDDVARLTASMAEVRRIGVVDYFDSQRFGSLKHGQGFLVKDLMRGELRDGAQELPGAPERARPHRRRQGEAVLEGELGRVGAPPCRPRRLSCRRR